MFAIKSAVSYLPKGGIQSANSQWRNVLLEVLCKIDCQGLLSEHLYDLSGPTIQRAVEI